MPLTSEIIAEGGMHRELAFAQDDDADRSDENETADDLEGQVVMAEKRNPMLRTSSDLRREASGGNGLFRPPRPV